jgi:hypothetical protein
MAARPGRCIVFIAILALAGCGEPETVRVHDETPTPAPKTAPIPADQKKFRTLVAMVPADAPESSKTWWFFRMVGPAPLVGKYEADFDRLFNTLQATSDENDPIRWELPPGWTWTKAEKAPGAMASRYGTLKSPGGEMEIVVTQFGGSVLANAQRWWGDFWGKDKAQDFTATMLPEYVQQKNVKGRLILKVDMAGPNEPPQRPGSMMGNPHGAMNPHSGMPQ